MIIRECIHAILLVSLLAAQVLVFNHVHLLGYATPQVYVAFLLYFPLNYSRTAILVWAFVMGVAVDVFSNTPGVASGSLTLTALLQPVLLRHITPKDAIENMSPNFHTLGYRNYVRFFALLVIIHHVAAFLLESFSCHDIAYVAISCGCSIVLTTSIIWATEHLLNRKS